MSYNNIFSIPVSRKKQISMRRKFIFFSSALFLLIFIFGSAAFVFLMKQTVYENAGSELTRLVEIEKFRLEAYMNSEIAIVRKMASSPLIRQYFLNPDDFETAKTALTDIEGYRRTFASKTLFWVNDADRKFYLDSVYVHVLDPNDPAYYWYDMTMYETEDYNFNINYNPNLNVTNLWINAPVFDAERKPLGVLGTGINLTDFVNTINDWYSGPAKIYFFNAAGEITEARDIEIVADKVKLDAELGQVGAEIIDGVKNLKDGEIKFFNTHDGKGVAAYCRIPTLGWNIAVVQNFTIVDSLQTGMTFLFGVMMAVIFSIFVVFNIFASILLEPLNRLIKTLSQISSEWNLKPPDGANRKGEVETLGEFLSMTIVDPLTSLYNRRFLNGHLKKFIKTLSRSGGKLSLLLIDIDFFKRYNDTYGHDAGDACLKTVAAVLARCVTRNDDFVARFGGEEFVAVLPNTDEEGARLIAEKMRINVCDCCIPHRKNDASDFITISIGGTTDIVKHYHDESYFIRRADEALYMSKHCGRNRYTFRRLEE